MFEPIAEIYLAEELALVKFKSEEEVEKWNKKVENCWCKLFFLVYRIYVFYKSLNRFIYNFQLLDESVEARQALLNNADREVYRRTYLSSVKTLIPSLPQFNNTVSNSAILSS